jgi:hypothetical protein
MSRIPIAVLWGITLLTPAAAEPGDRWQSLGRERDAYRAALDAVRKEHGGARRLPAVDFFLFGMGDRRKLLYHEGKLTDARTGAAIRSWDVAEERIVPPAYSVAVKTKAGALALVVEDADGIWIEEDGRRTALCESKVSLPQFAGWKHRLVLRVLHQEILVNVVDGRPVPNFFVYPKPWYRDGAMMAMALAKTGNLGLIKNWIRDLRDPFDRNNGGETEADNLGQALYLISLVAAREHPLVPAIRGELRRFEKRSKGIAYIEGRSDFAPHPVYQTKWANFGLRSLGFDDPYIVPKLDDSYATLFWWGWKRGDKPGQGVIQSDDYPYLTWAGCHSTGAKKGKLSDRDYPLTWEAQASQARYEGMRRISPAYVGAKLSTPHTWHAAEAFLYLLDTRDSERRANRRGI